MIRSLAEHGETRSQSQEIPVGNNLATLRKARITSYGLNPATNKRRSDTGTVVVFEVGGTIG